MSSRESSKKEYDQFIDDLKEKTKALHSVPNPNGGHTIPIGITTCGSGSTARKAKP
jgi:hypothetical protein